MDLDRVNKDSTLCRYTRYIDGPLVVEGGGVCLPNHTLVRFLSHDKLFTTEAEKFANDFKVIKEKDCSTLYLHDLFRQLILI